MSHQFTEDRESNSLLAAAKYTMVFTLLAAATVAATYIIAFWGRAVEPQTDAWGQLGDFFGGVLNPIVGLATVVLVFITVRIQTRELRSSLEELRQSNLVLEAQLRSTAKQNFEQTLFAWLSNYRDLLDAVVIHGDDTFTGRRALHSMYLRYLAPRRLLSTTKHDGLVEIRHLFNKAAQSGERLNESTINSLEEATRDVVVDLAAKGFDKLYVDHEFQLDSLFRTLFRIFRWIDQHEELSNEQKWFYAALVRAQLSWTELTLLFYNGMTERGAPFTSIANKYAIFDNLTLHSDIVLLTTKLSKGSMPYGHPAFSSAEAKRLLERNRGV